MPFNTCDINIQLIGINTSSQVAVTEGYVTLVYSNVHTSTKGFLLRFQDSGWYGRSAGAIPVAQIDNESTKKIYKESAITATAHFRMYFLKSEMTEINNGKLSRDKLA